MITIYNSLANNQLLINSCIGAAPSLATQAKMAIGALLLLSQSVQAASPVPKYIQRLLGGNEIPELTLENTAKHSYQSCCRNEVS